jgi:hypothetical protein
MEKQEINSGGHFGYIVFPAEKDFGVRSFQFLPYLEGVTISWENFSF